LAAGCLGELDGRHLSAFKAAQQRRFAVTRCGVELMRRRKTRKVPARPTMTNPPPLSSLILRQVVLPLKVPTLDQGSFTLGEDASGQTMQARVYPKSTTT
jgi:hypothetical protein